MTNKSQPERIKDNPLEKEKCYWDFSLFKVIMLYVVAFIFGAQFTILVTRPDGESITGAAFGAASSVLMTIVFFGISRKR